MRPQFGELGRKVVPEEVKRRPAGGSAAHMASWNTSAPYSIIATSSEGLALFASAYRQNNRSRWKSARCVELQLPQLAHTASDSMVMAWPMTRRYAASNIRCIGNSLLPCRYRPPSWLQISNSAYVLLSYSKDRLSRNVVMCRYHLQCLAALRSIASSERWIVFHYLQTTHAIQCCCAPGSAG